MLNSMTKITLKHLISQNVYIPPPPSKGEFILSYFVLNFKT
jgi:hypothetical protein